MLAEVLLLVQSQVQSVPKKITLLQTTENQQFTSNIFF